MATHATSSASDMIESGNLRKASSWLRDAMKADPTYAFAPYQLARLHETQEDMDKALEMFDQAIELGFSELPLVRSDKRLEKIRQRDDFAEKLKRIRQNYVDAAPVRCGQPLAARPEGEKPSEGWPLLLILPEDYSQYKNYIYEADSWAELGVVAVAVPGTIVLTNEKYRWHDNSIEFTHQDLQKIVNSDLLKDVVDKKQVFLMGCLEGASHAIHLAALHPEKYKGVVAAEPAGPMAKSIEKLKLSKKSESRCLLVHGQKNTDTKIFDDCEAVFSAAGWKFKIERHRWRTPFPRTWSVLRDKVKDFLFE